MSKRMSNDIHRSKELDKFLGQNVVVTFYDNKTESGVLEYGIPLGAGMGNPKMYCLNRSSYFRKTHIKKVKPYERKD